MLRIVCWKWRQYGYRSVFEAQHVNVLRNMVERHYPHPHEFCCITDDPSGLDKRVRHIPIWDDFSSLVSPHGEAYPSCYRRLKVFSTEARKLIGPRFVSLDLDAVIVGDMSPVWNRAEDFVIWGDTHPKTPYNGSMFMLDAGARPHVWDHFHPVHSPIETRKRKIMGSDQAWISHILGPHEAKWGVSDGVYSWRMHVKAGGGQLPKDARIVFFHGSDNPWDYDVAGRHAWVRESWR